MKPELIAFSQNTIGGVQSFYYNLLRYDTNHVFNKTWILADDKWNTNPRPKFPYNSGYENIFNYRSDVPTFHILKELKKFVSDRPGIILVNFPLELSLLHVYRNKKTIAFVCHDIYFVQFARQYDFLIDLFIVHNPHFLEVLREALPTRKDDIYYLPYGIELPKLKNEFNTDSPLKIITIARMMKEKGVLEIPKIYHQIRSMGIDVRWTLAGDGPERAGLIKELEGEEHIRFVAPSGSEEMYQEIARHDIFLLPSFLDGLPVTLMESMGCGLVPVLSEFNPGIKKIISGDIGFVLPPGDVSAFADVIADLNNNRNKLKAYRERCLDYAYEMFDIKLRSRAYYDLFGQYKSLKKPIRRKYIKYGRQIDHPAVPGFVRSNYYRIRNILTKVI